MSNARTPFVGGTETVTSPEDEGVTFTIKRVGNREYIQHQNINKTIRYVQRTGDDGAELASERDFPLGDMKIQTILLGLADWNLVDSVQRAIPINEETIQTYLSPGEFDFVYEQVLEVNPILRGDRGRETRKNS